MTWTGRVARGIAIACVFAGTLELAARVDDHLTWDAPLWGVHDPEVLRQVGEDGIPRNVPGARYEKWRVNSLGFRGPEVDREKDPGRRRIMILGQSESFGLYESEGGEWPERLRRDLASKRIDVEIINASVVGIGRSTRKAYLDRYLLPLRPDVVVLVPNVFSEASADVASSQEAPVVASSRPPPPPRITFQSRVMPKLSQKVKEALPGRLVAAIQLWRLERQIRKLEERASPPRRSMDRVPVEALERYETVLGGLVEHLRERGAAVALATYPTLAHEKNRAEHRHPLLAQRVYHLEFSEDGLLDVAEKYNDATRRVAREMGVPLLDLDGSVPETKDYFVDQVHYTDKGAQAVAEKALKGLVDSRLLEQAPPPQ